jgi:uncharacterized membrane-anchored protein
MNQIFKIIIFSAIFIFIFITHAMAQGPAPIETPLDPASLAVLIGGGALALKKIRDNKNKKVS